jgi:AraC-like DNA-binding protein
MPEDSEKESLRCIDVFLLLKHQLKNIESNKTFSMSTIHLSLKDLQKVCKAAILITEHVQEHYTIPQLAVIVALPEKKLKTGFKQLFNKGPYEFRAEYLWAKVKGLLLEDLPLKCIAKETGFKNESALIKAFRYEFACTPVQWKKGEENKIFVQLGDKLQAGALTRPPTSALIGQVLTLN